MDVAPPGALAYFCASSPAAQETMRSPGASRSGFNLPSPVGPRDEKYDTPVAATSSTASR